MVDHKQLSFAQNMGQCMDLEHKPEIVTTSNQGHEDHQGIIFHRELLINNYPWAPYKSTYN